MDDERTEMLARVANLSHEVERLKGRLEAVKDGCCVFAGPGRGDCEHAVGLPGESIPGQHDGDDDTVDHTGKPNGWCSPCWRARRLDAAVAECERLRREVFQHEKASGVTFKPMEGT